MGYAGFPIACLFSRGYRVTGFDISPSRVAELNAGHDHCGDVSEAEIAEVLARGTNFTNDIESLRECNFYVVVVPTPVDDGLHPDFSYLRSASREVGKVLSEGDVVVYESTVSPGITEEICVTELERVSGLSFNRDFFVGYSPERINPGDKIHTIDNVVKVTSGSTPEAARYIDSVYASVLGEGRTWQASSIRVAEACKVVENAQRDVNIAFMNEIARVMQSLDIDMNEVLEAMNTKWNALRFRPGLVGGHCIGVDPYYLIERASDRGVKTELMTAARAINNSQPDFVVENLVRQMKARGGTLNDARVLLLGFTFKENCPDVRNTRVNDILRIMGSCTEHVTVYDPWVDAELARRAYGVEICTDEKQIPEGKYDVVMLCVAHDCFLEFDFESRLAGNGMIYDVKGLLSKRKKNLSA